MKHIPPAGQSILDHKASSDCPCNPQRVTKSIGRASGRGGSHQGYRYAVTFVHNILVKESE